MKTKLLLYVKNSSGHSPVFLVPGASRSHPFVWNRARSAHVLALDPQDRNYQATVKDILSVTGRQFPIFADISVTDDAAAPAPAPRPAAASPSSDELARQLPPSEPDPAPDAAEPQDGGEPASEAAAAGTEQPAADGPINYTRAALEDMTVTELRDLAKERGIKGVSRATESALISKHLAWQKANLD
jgi:hypothetical protein